MWGNARLPTGVRVIGVNSVWMVWELRDATLYCLGAHFHPEAGTLRKRYLARVPEIRDHFLSLLDLRSFSDGLLIRSKRIAQS